MPRNKISYKKASPKNSGQEEYMRVLDKYPLVIAEGSPGVGKTFLAVDQFMELYKDQKIHKLIVARPAVASENLGFLPGNLEEKLDPYVRPVFDAIENYWTPSKLNAALQERIIEISAIAFMKGRTFRNCYVILDEAQDTTIPQIKLFLSRIGENVKVVITGDLNSSDIPDENGLRWLTEKLQTYRSDKICVHKFFTKDIVRSDLMRELMENVIA